VLCALWLQGPENGIAGPMKQPRKRHSRPQETPQKTALPAPGNSPENGPTSPRNQPRKRPCQSGYQLLTAWYPFQQRLQFPGRKGQEPGANSRNGVKKLRTSPKITRFPLGTQGVGREHPSPGTSQPQPFCSPGMSLVCL
jgi:hypothetical protein